MAIKYKNPHFHIEGADPNVFVGRAEADVRDDGGPGKIGEWQHDVFVFTIVAGDWPLTKAAIRQKGLAALDAKYPGAAAE